jgi:hypothetical protein
MSEAIHLLNKSRSAVDADGSEIVPPSLRAVAILFLSHGRNAWHSTWVWSYQFGDFFREGRKVRELVERRKERGTVFYLTALPGFQIDYGDRKFIITEINTFEPFRHMDLMTARYGLMSYNLKGFLDIVGPPSSLWKHGQSARNSVIVQEVNEDFIDFASYGALSKGAGSSFNPPIGNYERTITGSSYGVSDWDWTQAGHDRPTRISLRWYNQALEALVESRERLAEHLR